MARRLTSKLNCSTSHSSLSGRRRFGEATFAGIDGKEEDAPTPVVGCSSEQGDS